MDVGAAFNNPSSGKIDQQRKILEDLERQKKLLKAGNPPTLGMPPLAAPAVTSLPSKAAGQLTSGQRTALEDANKTSFGFFIHQDSSFGNVILPVIPRLQPKQPPPAK